MTLKIQPVNAGATGSDTDVVEVVTVVDVVGVVGGAGGAPGTIRYAPEYVVASAEESTSVPCGSARSKLEIAFPELTPTLSQPKPVESNCSDQGPYMSDS